MVNITDSSLLLLGPRSRLYVSISVVFKGLLDDSFIAFLKYSFFMRFIIFFELIIVLCCVANIHVVFVGGFFSHMTNLLKETWRVIPPFEGYGYEAG